MEAILNRYKDLNENKYDDDNIFAKIIRKEVPCDIVYEDEYVLSFRDISPRAPEHVLIIPKNKYSDLSEFSQKANDKEICSIIRCFDKLAKKLGLNDKGYRVITNIGINGRQEVPHLHFHLLGGKDIGRMIAD